MAKFSGTIGYAIPVEIRPGVTKEQIVPKHFCGELIRNSRRLQSSGDLNDDIVISNEVSILADPFAKENFHAMRYAEFMGAKWKITSVDVRYPRLFLTLGGVYNG